MAQFSVKINEHGPRCSYTEDQPFSIPLTGRRFDQQICREGQTYVDTCTKIAQAKRYTTKTLITAADRVLRFHEEHDLTGLRIMTGRGLDYYGRVDKHDLQRLTAINGIDHTKAKVKSPPTKDVWFRKTILQKFYQITFRKTLYGSIDRLQADLDNWLHHSNQARMHQGKIWRRQNPHRNYGPRARNLAGKIRDPNLAWQRPPEKRPFVRSHLNHHSLEPLTLGLHSRLYYINVPAIFHSKPKKWPVCHINKACRAFTFDTLTCPFDIRLRNMGLQDRTRRNTALCCRFCSIEQPHRAHPSVLAQLATGKPRTIQAFDVNLIQCGLAKRQRHAGFEIQDHFQRDFYAGQHGRQIRIGVQNLFTQSRLKHHRGSPAWRGNIRVFGTAPFTIRRECQDNAAGFRSLCQGHICFQDLIGHIFQKQAKRAGILQKGGVAETAGPDQIARLQQLRFKPVHRPVDQTRDHRRIGARRFSCQRGAGTDLAHHLHFQNSGQNFRRNNHQAKPLFWAFQNDN